jgi:hypothetical protein
MKKTIVIMQPTFLPWAGYFNLMVQSKEFVFLNDTQLSKQSWQTRNRIIVSGKEHWLSLPILHDRISQTINETQLANTLRWRKKTEQTFLQNYNNHPHFVAAYEIIDLLFSNLTLSLGRLNELIISYIATKINISTHIHRSSELEIDGVRSMRLLDICEHFNADEYLSPLGSADYLKLDQFEDNFVGRVRFNNYSAEYYPQKGTSQFISNLSIIDVVANLGWDGTRQYVISGNNDFSQTILKQII